MKTQARINQAIIWMGFFFIVSLAWLVAISPMVVVGLWMIFGHSQLLFNVGIGVLVVMLPFVGFPASAAAMKLMLPFLKTKRHDYIWRRFFTSWRQDYLVVLGYGAINTLAFLISGLAFVYYWHRLIPLAILFLIVLVVLGLSMVYGLPLLVTRTNTALADVKNSILLLIMHPVEAITAWLAVITVSMLLLKLAPVILGLIAPAIWIAGWGWFYLKMTRKVAVLGDVTEGK